MLISNKDRKEADRAAYRSIYRRVKLPKAARAEKAKREAVRNETNRRRNAAPIVLLNHEEMGIK